TGPGYKISGNAILLAAGFDATTPTGNFEDIQQFAPAITLTAPQTFATGPANQGFISLTGTIDLNGQALTVSLGQDQLTIAHVTGAGALTVTATPGVFSTLALGDSDYTGPTTVSGGRVAAGATSFGAAG